MSIRNDGTGAASMLLDVLIDLVPRYLLDEFGEVFYSGATAFEGQSPVYLLGFNPGGDPTDENLRRYTIASDLEASRGPDRRDWTGFEDDWRDFGPGAVAFQRRVLHLLTACGFSDPRKVPASNVLFVRSARIATLDTQRTGTLLRDCWVVHEQVIQALGVQVVICFGQDAGRWVRAQVGANNEPPSETFTESNNRGWRSTTHVGRDGIQVVTLTHPSVADWTNPLTDPTGLVVNALARVKR